MDHTIVLAVPFYGHFECCSLRWVPVRLPLQGCLLCFGKFLNFEDLSCLHWRGFASSSNYCRIGASFVAIVALLLQSPLPKSVLLEVLKLRLRLGLGFSNDYFRLLRLFHNYGLRLANLRLSFRCWLSLLDFQGFVVNILYHCALYLFLQHDQLLC